MKKILLFLAVICAMAVPAKAEWLATQSSMSNFQVTAPMMISSSPIELVAVTITSPTQDGLITVYRSTSPNFDSNTDTQTQVNCNYSMSRSSFTNDYVYEPMTIPFYGIHNDSYTFLQVQGNCSRTIFFKYTAPEIMNEGDAKIFGLRYTGMKRGPGQLP